MKTRSVLSTVLCLAGLASATASYAIPATLPPGLAFAPNAEADSIFSFTPGFGTTSTALPVPPPVFNIGDIFDGQLSLGDGGEVILEFTDNVLSTGDKVGLWENGQLEGAQILLGTNSTTFYSVNVNVVDSFGTSPLTNPTTIFDVDADVIAWNNLPSNTTFTFLKIIDDNVSTFVLPSVFGYDFLLAAQLRPVPEPSTLLMVSMGVLGLVGAVRRRG